MVIVLNAKGTSVQSFQIGKQGPKIKNSSGVVEFRNTSDTDFVEIRSGNLTSTGIDDNASVISLTISDTTSAVNSIDITGGVVDSGPTISSIGSDTNVDLNIIAKGTGNVVIGDVNGPGGIKAADGTAGPGELLSLEGGDGDTNQDGGNLQLKAGLGDGSGTGGEVNLTGESGIRFVNAAFSNVTALASGTSVTPNLSTSNYFTWDITGHATLNNPTNVPGAGSWYIYITVDASIRTLTLGANYKEVVNSQGFTGTATKTYILRILSDDGTNLDVWIDERGV